MTVLIRFLLLFVGISATLEQISLPGQIPYWIGGAAPNALPNNQFSLGELFSGLGYGTGGYFGLGGFGVPSFSGLGNFGNGFDALRIPFGGAGTGTYPCTPCLICSQQGGASKNCMPSSGTQYLPYGNQYCCCCAPGTGAGVGAGAGARIGAYYGKK